MLILPATAETVAGFVAAAEAAPDELTTIANVMNCPPMPFVAGGAPRQPGHPGAWSAGRRPGGGAEAMAPFRALAEPLADLVRPIRYPEMYPPEDPDYHPTAVARTMFVNSVDLDTAGADRRPADRVRRAAARGAAPGARRRGRPGAGRRHGVRPPDQPDHGQRRRVLRRARRPGRPAGAGSTGSRGDLHQGDDGAYVNFLGDEGPDRVRAAYPGATWDRLAAVKATYDPENLFRLNQNVPPAGAA